MQRVLHSSASPKHRAIPPLPPPQPPHTLKSACESNDFCTISNPSQPATNPYEDPDYLKALKMTLLNCGAALEFEQKVHRDFKYVLPSPAPMPSITPYQLVMSAPMSLHAPRTCKARRKFGELLRNVAHAPPPTNR